MFGLGSFVGFWFPNDFCCVPWVFCFLTKNQKLCFFVFHVMALKNQNNPRVLGFLDNIPRKKPKNLVFFVF